MVIQGIRDRNAIRGDEVIRKQGCGDKGEMRETGKGGKERPGDGCSWEEGEIQGRSREDP